MKFEDRSGQKFGRLETLRRAGYDYKNKKIKYIFKCDCGTIKIIVGAYVFSGKTTSCGCYIKEIAGKARTSHGATKKYKRTKEYQIWCGVKQRCLNKKNLCYNRYGGRGITLCKRWFKFENFILDMGIAPSLKHTIERINNEKGYTPKNCRWATLLEQARNSRKNLMITYLGKTQCLSAWAEELGFKYQRVRDRINKLGWSFEKALSEPKLR